MLWTLVVGIGLLAGTHARVVDSVDDDSDNGRMFGGSTIPTSAPIGFLATINGNNTFVTAPSTSVPTTTCGGVIINTTLVLTTATCVYKMQYAIVSAGYTNISADNSQRNQTRYMVDKFIHPGWEMNTGLNDIALIRVFPPFYFNEFVRAIPLPKSSVVKGDGMAKVPNLTWISWGSINSTNFTQNITKSSPFIYMPSKACTTFYSKAPFYFNVPATMMCMNLTTTLGYCNLDNGSPLVGYDAKTKAPFLAGFAAIDRDNLCGPNSTATNFYTPDLFTRVDSFFSWIAAMGGPKSS